MINKNFPSVIGVTITDNIAPTIVYRMGSDSATYVYFKRDDVKAYYTLVGVLNKRRNKSCTFPCVQALYGGITPLVPTVCGTPNTPLAIQNGANNSQYSNTFQGSGGTAPYTFAFITGPSPVMPGMILNPSTGVWSGTTPDTGGVTTNYSFTIEATDSKGCKQRQMFTLQTSST